ncbi:hypothetical protein MPTK1_6g09770 [Marchantia polymorpha subsp. ruderalis]|uniref:Uncharacterized protein n=2 Tax=Marchantia polymorpha TaxID=3197 RepID=A0A176VWZ6_MARPO|nr:hypothetical protein AXG93_4620s1490 [Marchantia polymorpha subsp. ruderalis]PTQ44940.1 hypothetical protein MARPO_0016s0021 [Marchantia polymorpha]BBN14205.1 hypothetical protein Mp_6g09770 [Marchantia polymorpha subsp. ruderalis]|eukprot:PTQ44940.1 hypothetical protein MARPO_0016s0021 [Marchantia polymorpha]
MQSRNPVKPKDELSSQNDRRTEGSALRHSSNGVKSLAKPNSVSSVKGNGTSSVKRELTEKSNGASVMKANGSAIVKRDASDVKKEASTSGAKAIVKKSVSVVSTTTKVVTKKTKTEEKEKKKVFTLPGQKHEAPEERDSLRIFYESLHEQRPDSEMAEFWMMEHGLLSPERAKKAFEKKQKRGHSSFGTPVKNSTPSRDTSSKLAAKSSVSNGKASASKVSEQKGKRKWESDSDDDLLIARPLKRKLKT